jgi:hypothetical protein
MRWHELDDPAVLGYWREHGEDRVLCLFNLSNQPASLTLDLHAFEGHRIIDLLHEGGERGISHWPQVQHLAPYASHWLLIA